MRPKAVTDMICNPVPVGRAEDVMVFLVKRSHTKCRSFRRRWLCRKEPNETIKRLSSKGQLKESQSLSSLVVVLLLHDDETMLGNVKKREPASSFLGCQRRKHAFSCPNWIFGRVALRLNVLYKRNLYQNNPVAGQRKTSSREIFLQTRHDGAR